VDNGARHLRIELSERLVGRQRTGSIMALENQKSGGGWFWRWKFKLADRARSIQPRPLRLALAPGSASWIIPTAFSVNRHQTVHTPCSAVGHFKTGAHSPGCGMLLDRVVPGGGLELWNSVVYGSAASGPRGGHRNRLLACRTRTDAGDPGQSGLAQAEISASSRWRVSPGAFSLVRV